MRGLRKVRMTGDCGRSVLEMLVEGLWGSVAADGFVVLAKVPTPMPSRTGPGGFNSLIARFPSIGLTGSGPSMRFRTCGDSGIVLVEALTIFVTLLLTPGLAASGPMIRFLYCGDVSIELLEFGIFARPLLLKTGLPGSGPRCRLRICGDDGTEAAAFVIRLVMTGLLRPSPRKRPVAKGDVGGMWDG